MVIWLNEKDIARSRWCILRTSGARTLALAASLSETGIEAWSPKRTLKRPVPGKRPKLDGKRPMMEVDTPILPTFVFARATHLNELAALAADPACQHPGFSIFRHATRFPLVAEADVAGLQEAERAAALSIQQQRDAETREEADAIRVAALKTERARMRALKQAEHEQRKMLRAERRDFSTGERVHVDEEPSFVGMSGVVVSSDGRHAVVCFGGSLTMKVEAWQLSRNSVQDTNIAA